jgi:agmatine deiminase
MPYGDIWLRDTGPIFLHNNLQTEARCFEFNGWGGKYLMPFDDQVSREIAVRSGVPFEEIPIIFEGGSIDCNGNGVVLTTEECLLNANRNPTMSRRDIEKSLDSSLGIENILWLKRGLKFDHTDGHIDNCARFINETKIVAMKSVEKDDPQRERLREIADQLEVFATQMGLNVITIPSPGLVVDPFGDVMPASYLNFLISNDVVLVPIFNVASDETALSMLQEHFPNHKVLGLPSYYILTGGGSFHCISQQEPAQ